MRDGVDGRKEENAFNALFNKRDYESALQFVPAAGMSPFGPLRTCPPLALMSAFRGRADMPS
jgi:hypothetical protein